MINELVDRYERAREARLLKDRELGELRALEAEALQALITGMEGAGHTHINGSNKLAVLFSEDQPVVRDWGLFYEHIEAVSGWHLLQRRISSRSVLEELEGLSEGMPGIEVMQMKRIKLKNL